MHFGNFADVVGFTMSRCPGAGKKSLISSEPSTTSSRARRQEVCGGSGGLLWISSLSANIAVEAREDAKNAPPEAQ